MTGPYLGPTPMTFERIQQGAQQAQDQLAEHQASYAAARQANVAASYNAADPARDAALGRIGKHRTATNLAVAAIWTVGYYVLPKPVRKWYVGTTAFSILAVVTTDLDAWNGAGESTHDYGEPWGGFDPIWEGGWRLFIGVPTVWTVLFGTLAAICLFKWVTMVRQIKRQHLLQQQVAVDTAQVVADIDQVTGVHEAQRGPAPVVVTPSQEPPAPSKLWLPTSPTRRVRRGGETLSGVPIKDRRSVDPRTL